MPSAATQLSSIDDFFTKEQLLGDYIVSISGQNSLRSSRLSLIKSKRIYFHREHWLPVALNASLLGIFATLSILLVFACVLMRLKSCESPSSTTSIMLKENPKELDRISEELASKFDPKRIKQNVRWMAETSHISGTVENLALIRRIADEYRKLGFTVDTYNYTVLLNYPDFENANTVMVEKNGGMWWRLSRGRGHPRGPRRAVNEQVDGRSEVWWNAYSADGSVEGRIVYCNFGAPEDFKTLEENEIDVNGSIALMRYGALVRSEKVAEAEKRGAIGAILFSDPALYMSSRTNKSFPYSMSLPGSAAQRGSIGRMPGDPLTPLLPSLPYVSRTETIASLRRRKLLPSIPVTPVSYHDTQRIMSYMDGPLVTQSDWTGGLRSYRLNSSRRFRLSVRSRFMEETITNIIATFRGSEEPDRWIMLGNHIDAWGKGAVDPISGTAVQLEVARVVSEVFRSTPPRRSLVFCHWDAEEFGLIGSSEWIEQRLGILQRRAVAYINVDHIAGGELLDIKAVPVLYRAILEAVKRAPSTNGSSTESFLDSREHLRSGGPSTHNRGVLEIGLPSGGSDYQRFITFAGIPAADLKLEPRPGQSYALYHTMYETPWTVENLIDPSFSSFTSIGQLWIEIVHRLANSLVIPFNVLDYAQSLISLFRKVEVFLSKMDLRKASPWLPHKLNNVQVALRRFQSACRKIQLEAQDITSGLSDVSIQRLDSINTRLQYAERSFLDSTDVSNPFYRHLVFSPSKHSSRFTPFSSILDPAIAYQLTSNETHLHQLELAITKVQYAIESAIDTLH